MRALILDLFDRKRAVSERRRCVDCLRRPTIHFGIGSRCAPHADRFKAKIHAERVARLEAERKALAEHIAADCPDDGIVCESCCEHEFDPDEGMMCINCNKEWDGP